MRYITSKVDINKQNYIKLDCMQNDDISLEVTLLENGVAYPVKNNVITLNWLKADNTFVVISGSRITINNNIITIKLPRDCTRAVGQSKFELVIKDNISTQISTFPLSIDVTGSILGGNEASKNVLTVIEGLDKAVEDVVKDTMNLAKSKKTELDNSIKNAQSGIDKIESAGNGTFIIPSTSWVGIAPNLTYKLNHKLNSKSLIVGVIDTDTQKSMFPDFKYVDMNNIEMQSTTKQNITVSINANYYSGKDANTVAQEVIDSRKGKTSLKAKIDEVDTGISEINKSMNTMNTSINDKQAKTDNTLTTTNKNIVGAINENTKSIKTWEDFKSKGGDIGGNLTIGGVSPVLDNYHSTPYVADQGETIIFDLGKAHTPGVYLFILEANHNPGGHSAYRSQYVAIIDHAVVWNGVELTSILKLTPLSASGDFAKDWSLVWATTGKEDKTYNSIGSCHLKRPKSKSHTATDIVKAVKLITLKYV